MATFMVYSVSAEAATGGVLLKKVFLKNITNDPRPVPVFSSGICEIFKNTYFYHIQDESREKILLVTS